MFILMVKTTHCFFIECAMLKAIWSAIVLIIMMALYYTVLILFLPVISGRLLPKMGRYFINWDGGMKACKDADNTVFDMEKLVVEKKSKSLLALVGDVGLTKDTTNQIKFVLTVLKNINGNYEYLMKVEEANLCKHINEQKKPWTPFIKEMGITGCPIPKKVYSFHNSTLDTAGFPLTAAQAGHYRAKIEIFEGEVRNVCLMTETVVEPL